MENLYHYYFHYNIYTGEWCAFLRSEAPKHLNGRMEAFYDKDINNLIETIKKLENVPS